MSNLFIIITSKPRYNQSVNVIMDDDDDNNININNDNKNNNMKKYE